MTTNIVLANAEKVYGGAVPVHALAPTDLSFDEGELVVILGPSGSGKTTLLNLIGGLDSASAGRVSVCGHDLSGLDNDALCAFRRDCIGFVFQFFNLVPTLTVWENVALVAELTHTTGDVTGLLEALGLGGLADRFPGEMSGGQQQRVAIARALAKHPPVVLADEPTGALDHETGRQVLTLLRQAAGERRTVIVVTHDESITVVADRVIRLRDGRVVSDERNHPGDGPKPC